MPKPPKSFRTTLNPQLAQELLNVAPAKRGQSPEPLGIRLERARKALSDTIKECNEFLNRSELAPKVAEALAQERNKRGFPTISVDATGAVILEVDYDIKHGKKKKRQYRSGLPLLVDLRKEAEELGVDVSHLGQKRRAVSDFLEEVKQRRAAVASDEDAEPAQMAAGVDEVTVTKAKDLPRPPRVALRNPGTVAKAPSIEAKASPNLTAIMESAPEDVDISALLDEANEANGS